MDAREILPPNTISFTLFFQGHFPFSLLVISCLFNILVVYPHSVLCDLPSCSGLVFSSRIDSERRKECQLNLNTLIGKKDSLLRRLSDKKYSRKGSIVQLFIPTPTSRPPKRPPHE